MQSAAPAKSTSSSSSPSSASITTSTPAPASGSAPEFTSAGTGHGTGSRSRPATTVNTAVPPASAAPLTGSPGGTPPTETPSISAARRLTGRTNRSRKGHYSCEFCRVRKLRCDRPLPCTNCVSRGKKCTFVPAGVGAVHAQGQTHPANGQDQDQPHGQGRNVSSSSGPQSLRADAIPRPGITDTTSSQMPVPRQDLSSQPIPAPSTQNIPPVPAPAQGSLLAEIQALRRLAQDLEKRVATNHDGSTSSFTPPALTPTSARFDIGSSRAGLSSDIGEVGQVVAQLERVSMGQQSDGPIFADALVFKMERIQAIPRLPSYTVQRGKPTRCIVLPLQEEAKVLVDKFIRSVSYIYHVLHHPSLPAIVDDIYGQIEGREPVKPGHLVLLLSIIATATHVWAPSDGQTGSSSLLFSSAAQANAQTPLWLKATHDMLNARQSFPAPSLENVQGITILSFLISNIEGISLRFRALISTGLLLGRELGLHRIDHPSNAAAANSLEAEMGRRVWWYLVATDWLMAARNGGPGEGVYLANPDHMMVRQPRNLNDADLPNNFPHLDPPLSQPTEMSFFIQRLRLAEISRKIIDHNSMMASGPGWLSHDSHILALDVEIDRMLRDLPTFFHLEKYDRGFDPESTRVFIQAYMLNWLIQTVRTKLHINYLSFGADNCNPSYTFSRETCLGAARQLLRAEIQLMRARHPFVETRLHLSGILYGIFIASIVLLMDAYVTGSPLDETRRAEVNEALRIVEDAKGHSIAAATLHESLTNVLAKHRARMQQQCHERQQAYHPQQAPPQEQQQQHQQHQPQPQYQHHFAFQSMEQAPSSASTLLHSQPGPGPMTFVTSPPGGMVKELTMTEPMGGNMAAHAPFEVGQPVYDNQLAQGLEALMEYDGFQWDDLLSGIDSNSFF